ncbi:tRNA-binding protein [soil metagenome]
MTISFDQFAAVQVRVGRVQRAEPFPEARRPAFKLWIDFGDEFGVRRTSAQLTRNYTVDELRGRLVLAVTNFEPKQLGPFMSEVLVLGVPDADGEVVLLQPERDVPLGGLVY